MENHNISYVNMKHFELDYGRETCDPSRKDIVSTLNDCLEECSAEKLASAMKAML